MNTALVFAIHHDPADPKYDEPPRIVLEGASLGHNTARRLIFYAANNAAHANWPSLAAEWKGDRKHVTAPPAEMLAFLEAAVAALRLQLTEADHAS